MQIIHPCLRIFVFLSCAQRYAFHHQVMSSGGLAALACYTVDSDSDTEEEDEEKKVDFGDLYIKEEPVWSLDTDGHKDPQDLAAVPEFSVVQV